MDHHSRLSYVHLSQSTTSEELVEDKLAFGACACDYKVKIKHYHIDNGRFSDNAFCEAVEKGGHTISFSGMNAHFQHGIAENCIQYLQDHSSIILLFAQSRWPKVINAHLWKYAIRTHNLVVLSTLSLIGGIPPLRSSQGFQFPQKFVISMPLVAPFAC